MKFEKFIRGTDTYSTYTKPVPAPILRKSFNLDFVPEKSTLNICVSGLYELFINGKKITKGYLCPYFNNPDHILYYDTYDVTEYLVKGKNAVSAILGNGYANQDIKNWESSKAPFRAPLVMAMNFECSGFGNEYSFEADESFKAHSSALLYDTYKLGTIYDARKETEGFAEADFDDSAWKNAKTATPPKGKITKCEAVPINEQYILKPVSIEKQENFHYFIDPKSGKSFENTYVKEGYVYDFGKSRAGICRLKICGEKGQKVTLRHGEYPRDGHFSMNSIYTVKDTSEPFLPFYQADTYILKGGDEEIYVPSFTYHGFRYVLVEGITEAQATEDLLEFIVFNTDIKRRSDFSCSDESINRLYEMAIAADESNFHHFPTDCPHREKNGWTGDISVSAHQYLLSFNCEKSLSVWLENVRCAQKENGMLPGIVPTDTWGYAWGNGPVWDCVIVNVPYFIYKYSGNLDVFKENADMIYRYLKHIASRRDEKGLLAVGLCDWCQPFMWANPSSPLLFTDSAQIFEAANRSAFLFGLCGMDEEKCFAENLAQEMRKSIREHLIDFSTMTVVGECQTSQSVAIRTGLFDECEKEAAYKRLLEIVKEKDKGVIACGMFGLRYIFHTLFEGGNPDTALSMILHDGGVPSYKTMLDLGGTALFESLIPNGVQESQNHHFYGDIINLFITKLAGLRINPNMDDVYKVKICPIIPDSISWAKAKFDYSEGSVSVHWEKVGGKIKISVDAPRFVHGTLEFGGKAFKLEAGKKEYVF